MKRNITVLALILMVSFFVAARTSAQSNDPAMVRKAIEKSVPLLDGMRLPFLEKTGCFSCHHNSMPAMAVGLARDRGFTVSERTAIEESEQILAMVNAGREKLLLGDGFGGVQFTAAVTLIGLAANKQSPNKTTDVLVRFLLGRQSANGGWKAPVSRPPSEGSDIATTAYSVRAVQIFAPPGLRQETDARVERAREWLSKATPRTNEDYVFQLLGMAWAKADEQTLKKLTEGLLARQRKDGGWSQQPTLASDAFATGEALVALHQGGRLPVTDAAYQRGVKYLLDDQAADGTWAVLSRTLPLQKYFESGFPYGENQWISAAASSWATMALTLTVQAPANSAQRGGL